MQRISSIGEYVFLMERVCHVMSCRRRIVLSVRLRRLKPICLLWRGMKTHEEAGLPHDAWLPCHAAWVIVLAAVVCGSLPYAGSIGAGFTYDDKVRACVCHVGRAADAMCLRDALDCMACCERTRAIVLWTAADAAGVLCVVA